MFLCCHQPKASIFCLYNPDRLKSFFSWVSWLGIRALPSMARGLPDWLETFRGKRAERFWGLEIECETLGDAAHVSIQKYTLWRICSLQLEHRLIFTCVEGSASQEYKTAVCRWVIAPGLRIPPRNCTVRIWKRARLNNTDVLASSVHGRTEFPVLTRGKWHFLWFVFRWTVNTIFKVDNKSFYLYAINELLSPFLHV